MGLILGVKELALFPGISFHKMTLLLYDPADHICHFQVISLCNWITSGYLHLPSLCGSVCCEILVHVLSSSIL
jgi:hypothetical protein